MDQASVQAATGPVVPVPFRRMDAQPGCDAGDPILQVRFRWNNAAPDCAATNIVPVPYRRS